MLSIDDDLRVVEEGSEVINGLLLSKTSFSLFGQLFNDVV